MDQSVVRVKICGLTRIEDVHVACAAGAHAIGFMLYRKSKRYVSFEKAQSLASEVSPFVARVGVMVNPTMDEVKRAVEYSGMDMIQLHGDESPEFLEKVPVSVLKAFRIKDRDSLSQLNHYQSASAWLLDSYVAGEMGGTGHRFNWDLAVEAQSYGKPIILAGGLNAENISDAVKRVSPYGVDVSSGVEDQPGIKSESKIYQFINQVN